MQPSLDRRHQSTRRLRPLQAHKGRWMVNEYPAGYVAQLARPRAAKADRAERGAPSHPHAESVSDLSPAA